MECIATSNEFIFFNKEYIPKGQPFIIAANHPNSFLDALLLGSFLPVQLNFLVRGDIFKTKTVRFFLHQLNMIPIFRWEEGVENVAKNHDSFAEMFYPF